MLANECYCLWNKSRKVATLLKMTQSPDAIRSEAALAVGSSGFRAVDLMRHEAQSPSEVAAVIKAPLTKLASLDLIAEACLTVFVFCLRKEKPGKRRSGFGFPATVVQ